MYKVFSCLLQYLQSVLTCLFRTRVILVCSLAFRVNGQFSLTSESARLHSTKLWKPVLIQKRHTCESWILYVEFVVDDPRNFTLLKKLEIVLRVQKTLKCAMALTFPWTFLGADYHVFPWTESHFLKRAAEIKEQMRKCSSSDVQYVS